MNHCWAIDKILFTDQYKTSPAAKPANTNVNTKGSKANILACVGSAGAGFNFCWPHCKAHKYWQYAISIIDNNGGTFHGIINKSLKEDLAQKDHESSHRKEHDTFQL